jgi:hypothetical protein
VKERGSEGGATIAWFTSFSRETVHPMVEPLFQPPLNQET